MKKILAVLCFTFITATAAFAQRLAYVDSDYILKHMPEYASAQRQLEALSAQWQKEVDARYQEIDRLYKAYQADEVLMTPDMKKRRQAEIDDKEKSAFRCPLPPSVRAQAHQPKASPPKEKQTRYSLRRRGRWA